MNTDNLVVAVSYAHDSDEFNKKVVAFVSCLREKHGYDAIMDEYLKQVQEQGTSYSREGAERKNHDTA